MIGRFLLALFSCFFALTAWAQTCTVYIATAGGYTGDPRTSAESAVASAVAKFKAGVAGKQSNGCGVRGYYSPETAGYGPYGFVMVETEQDETNYQTGQKYCTGQWSGGSRSAVGVQIKTGEPCPDTCDEQKGKSEILNVTAGWKRTPKVSDTSEEWVYTYRLPTSGTATLCAGSNICQVTVDANEPCAECGSYVSQVPAANGLHRVSIDFRGHFTGKTCTATSESDLPPEATQRDDSKDPPCPGYVGEVQGVRGCYGTADKPIRPVPPPSKPSGHGDPDAGNPSAGSKPASGEGSGSGGAGRTPNAGTGGSGGGPAGAASGSGTKPDGTTTKPTDGKEQAACGAPGQPKCSINEAGTPDGKGAFDSANSGLDEGKKGWIAEIEKVKDLTAPGWTWTFQLPSGCAPLDVPAFNLTLDVCRFQPIIHDIMSMLWAIATVMGCALMVFNSTGKN